MIAKLTKEQAAALNATGKGTLELIDPDTQRRFVLVDSETHREAMEALARQQDLAAISQGVAEMEAGLGKPLDEAFADIRARLDLPPRT